MKQLLTPAIRLMNRLTYPQKFGLISLLFALPLGLVLVFFIAAANDRIGFARERSNLRRRLSTSRADLTRSYPGRPIADRRRPNPAQADLARSLAQLDSRFPDGGRGRRTVWRVAQDEHTTGGTQGRVEHAEGRAARRARPTPPSIPRLVGAIRGLITQVGDTSNLILDPDLDSYYVMDSVLLKLPEGRGSAWPRPWRWASTVSAGAHDARSTRPIDHPRRAGPGQPGGARARPAASPSATTRRKT